MCFSLTPGGKEKIQQMMNAELCFDGLFEKLKTCMEKVEPFLSQYFPLTNMYNTNNIFTT